eukprot:548379-Lingulodinium_polyedra.AAC.1
MVAAQSLTNSKAAGGLTAQSGTPARRLRPGVCRVPVAVGPGASVCPDWRSMGGTAVVGGY